MRHRYRSQNETRYRTFTEAPEHLSGGEVAKVYDPIATTMATWDLDSQPLITGRRSNRHPEQVVGSAMRGTYQERQSQVGGRLPFRARCHYFPC